MSSSMAPPFQTPRRPGPSATTPFKTPLRTPGEQTSQTPVVDFDLIEYQKENVQPMSKGRSAHSLSQTLALKHKERAEELAVKRQEYESKVQPDKLAESDDPLADWCDYVQWTIVSYPSGASADSGLITVLERATRSLRSDARYCNPHEPRYLKLWTLYSENVESPELILNWLLANDVGTACAELYEKAAAVAETRGLYESADSLFKLGIRRNAQPNSRLRKRFEEFKERLVRNQSAAERGLDYASALARAMRESRRTMLGNKDEKTGKSVHANVMRGAGKSAGLGSANTVNNGRKLNVFRDSEGSLSGADGKGPEASELGSRDVRRQENAKEAKGWNGERLPQKARLGGSSALTPGKKTLKVFADSDDEEAEEQRSPSKGRQLSNTKPMLGSSHPEVDLLKRDPFSRWSQDERAQVTALKGLQLGDVESVAQHAAPAATNSRRAPEPSRSSSGKSKNTSSASSSSRSSSSKPSAPPSGAKRPERLALPESLFYPGLDIEQANGPRPTTGSIERCVEQIIAARLGFKLNFDGDEDEDPWAYLDEPMEVEQPEPAMEEDDQGPEPMASSSSTPTRATVGAEREASSTPTQSGRIAAPAAKTPPREPTRTGMKPSSPTVMTKAAEAEVRALFNGGDEDSDEEEDEDSDEESSDEEEEEEQQKPARPSPPAASRDDENAGVEATPLRPSSHGQPLGLKTRGPTAAATPMRKPLGAVAATPLGGIGKKPIYVEEDEDEEPEEERPRPTAQRILPVAHEEDDEESDPDEEEQRQYNYGDGQDLLEGGARFDQLTTISERTEFETRWGMNTPGRSRSVYMPTNTEEDEEEEEENEDVSKQQQEKQQVAGTPSQERSFASESSEQRETSAGHTGRFGGGRAKFEMSPGYTIEKREDWTSEATSPSLSRKALAASSAVTSTSIPNPCSPTDADVLSVLLSSLPLSVETSPDFFDFSNISSGKLATLQRQAKAQTRKSVGNTSATGLVGGAKDWWLEIDGNPFSIREKLGEGAYGSVFLAEDVNNVAPPRHKKALGGILGDSSFDLSAQEEEEDEDEEDEDEAERKRMVAIKVESPANRWEFYLLGQLRARLSAERDLQSIIGARRFYAYQDESFLLLEWGEKGNLLEIVNQASSAGVAPAGATSGVEEVLAMFFTIELLRLVEGLHDAQLIHGDLKIDNCLLRLDDAPSGTTWSNSYKRDGSQGWTSKGLYLVDFGRAIDLSVFPEGQRFVADWQTDERDCLEMREGKSWTYEVDYHGVASIAFCLLFGRYIETEVGQDGRQKIRATLKRYWQGELWSRLFDVLLNSGAGTASDARGNAKAEAMAVRADMEGWLEENCMKGGKNLKGLLKKLEIWTMSRRG
ncbi:hypothetical protein BDZ90DRAFT_233572 [Jaminaea rosea]|uniref:Protein kinase domain-containing protein n=1 Tax=Jaminaea rosea TaxID=1569628 RepID=A0A316UNN4_9BASI|nr:hypothetical protein BDZ90DRAFT_233572 [Jaminaea rosea]PWN25971.1 hypothetical protein BDZ90DRAFT_233572 [Jaminaea rosea]